MFMCIHRFRACIQSFYLRMTIRLCLTVVIGIVKAEWSLFITDILSLYLFLSVSLSYSVHFFSLFQQASGNYSGKHLPWHSCQTHTFHQTHIHRQMVPHTFSTIFQRRLCPLWKTNQKTTGTLYFTYFVSFM